MAEYMSVAPQNVSLNAPVVFTSTSIPCPNGNAYHVDETGVFILKGNTNNCFARYQLVFNGNISVPEGGEVTPIGLAIAVEGEARPGSLAIYTPQAVDELGNITTTALVTVPKGCCFSASVRYVDATSLDPAVEPTPVINVQNANLVITRVA
jgi:hypothetical protein